jgi:type IX secretion system PorP/SprF family membrane protein
MKGLFTLFSFVFVMSFFLIPEKAQAQDPQFAQFYAAPLHTNPAMAGVFSGRFRVAVNYREQWGSVIDNPFRTFGAGLDIRTRIGKGDYIALGGHAIRDEAGISNYTQTAGYFNASYMKQLNGSKYRTNDQFLVGGLQVGIGQHALDFGNIWYSSQFDPGIVDVNSALPSNEAFNSTTTAYVDVNAGLLWYALFAENASFYLGGAVHHITQPQISFLKTPGSEGVVFRKYLAQAGGEIPFNTNLSMLPAAVFMSQGPSLTTLFGANFRYTNRDWREVAIRAGAWGQVSNKLETAVAAPSIIFTTILEMNRVNIGISYDVNAGDLAAPTNARGAFEVSLIYVHPASRRERVACPKF